MSLWDLFIAVVKDPLGFLVPRPKVVDPKQHEELWKAYTDIRERYDVLFYLYVRAIHAGRLGTGETCKHCTEMAQKQIEDELAHKRGT